MAIILVDEQFGYNLKLPQLPLIWFGDRDAAARWATKLGYQVSYQ